jgi:hypothetical protein
MTRPTNPELPTHDGQHAFSWHGSHGSACASDLGGRVATRVWKDACDVGFQVKGKTRTVLFVLTERNHDAEGDLRFELFTSYCGKYTISIFND